MCVGGIWEELEIWVCVGRREGGREGGRDGTRYNILYIKFLCN